MIAIATSSSSSRSRIRRRILIKVRGRPGRSQKIYEQSHHTMHDTNRTITALKHDV
jgi:hypothetical protein